MGHIIIDAVPALPGAALVDPAWVDMSSPVAVAGFEQPPTIVSEARALTTPPSRPDMDTKGFISISNHHKCLS